MGFALVLGAGMVALPGGAGAQGMPIVELVQGTSPLLLHTTSSQGYLGVDLADVDQEKAQALKLKEVRGAVITLIDHDAPAGQIGLKVNDVVLQLNGQDVEGAEQLRRMLKEIPAGRKVSLEFSRDGNLQTTSVELADRRAMEHDVWNKLGNDGDVFAQSPGMGVLAGGGDNALPGMFHMPIFGSTLNVGALVEPLTGQMAEYLGIPSGLMVKQVAHKSEAATAGLKAFDVILKVGADAVTTMSDWDRALRANQGKPVQVTILRDRKQQTVTLQVDSKRKTGELQMEDLFPDGSCPQVAELAVPELLAPGPVPDTLLLVTPDSQATAKALRDQIQGAVDGTISAAMAGQFRKQAEALRDQLKLDNFKIDQKQLDAMKQQMEEFRKNFKPDDFNLDKFKVDPKQMEEMKRQMEQFQMDFKPQDFEVAPD
jgi:membrane-associated protease RseP (regulator of RpoE activity)